jgi:hypothetical protein
MIATLWEARSIHRVIVYFQVNGRPIGWPRPRTVRLKGEVGRKRGPESSARRMNWMGVRGEECDEVAV